MRSLTMSRSTKRLTIDTSTKPTLHAAAPVFQSTVRPGSGFATQRRPTTLRFSAAADLPDQVWVRLGYDRI